MLTPRRPFLACAVACALGLFAHARDAHAAAQIELHFRCSPWLYLSEINGKMRDKFFWTGEIDMDIPGSNARLCTQNAQRLTFAANTVFALNGIPVTFRFTTEVVAGGGLVTAGLKFRHTLFTFGGENEATDYINAHNPFPDLHVGSVKSHVAVDTSTCNPWNAGTDACSSAVAASCPSSSSPFSLCRNAAGGTIYAIASPFITDRDPISMFETDAWSARTAVGAPLRINVSVRSIPGPNASHLGITYGLYDRLSAVLSLNDGTLTKRALTPSNYLPTVGVVTVIAGPTSLFNVTAMTHEIGHVFGAMHERAAALGGEFDRLAGLASFGYQFANVASSAPANYISYDTLMVSGLTADARLNFSTPVKWKDGPILCGGGKSCPKTAVSIGDASNDNRRYVFETLQWLTGDASLVLAAPADPRDAVLGKLNP